MFAGAEDTPFFRGVVVEASGILAVGERACLPVLGVVSLAVGAIRADEALDELLAYLFVEVDAFAVEPVLTHIAAYHPSVIVWSTAEAVRTVVGLVVGAAAITAAGFARHPVYPVPRLGALCFLGRSFRRSCALLLGCRPHLGRSCR